MLNSSTNRVQIFHRYPLLPAGPQTRPSLPPTVNVGSLNTIAPTIMESSRTEAATNQVQEDESETTTRYANSVASMNANTTGSSITGPISSLHTYICDICKPQKTFTRAEQLRRHLLSHPPAAYPCKYPSCDKTFHRQDLLDRHTIRHEQDDKKAKISSFQLQPNPLPGFRNSLPSHSASNSPNSSQTRGQSCSKPPPREVKRNSPPRAKPPPRRQRPIHDKNHEANRGSKNNDCAILPSLSITTTVYSAVPSIVHGIPDKFITAIAKKIITELSQSISEHLPQDLSFILPGLLTASADRFGYMKVPSVDSSLIPLISRQISRSIINAFNKEEDNTLLARNSPSNSHDMILDEKISLWESQKRFDDHASSMDFDDVPKLQEHRDYTLNSPAHRWLKSAILKALRLETINYDLIRNIQQPILGILRDSDKSIVDKTSTTYCVTFHIPRLPLDRIKSIEDLPQTIVLVGEENHAYATTCDEYLRLVWPESGPQILELFSSVEQKKTENAHTCRLFDGSEVTIILDEQRMMLEVTVTGSIYSIVEVGEQVAWMATAFNLSINFGQLSIISRTPLWASWPGPSPVAPFAARITTSGFEDRAAGFILEYPLSDYLSCPNDLFDGYGKCWTRLFGRLTLVKGYPIPRRARPGTGIEIPLPMLAALANSQKVARFSGKFLIKGYSIAAIPTSRCDEFIYWHVVSNESGDYLGFSDSRIKDLFSRYPSGLTLGDLEFGRHIVGWCAYAKNNTGTPNANYSIKWSCLGPPATGLALEKISIVGGMFVTGGASMLVGKRDKAIQLQSRDDYIMRLKWVSKKFVVLYDVEYRRAWLVDGLSALLHLLRTSLKHDLQDPFKSLFLYDPSALKEASGVEEGKDSAIRVLTNPENLKIPLYAKPESAKEEVTANNAGAQARILSRTKSNYCLKDRIESFCDVLEQIIAYQTDMEDQDGVGFKLRCTPRRHLEGFDFMDIATDEDPIRPRMINLRSSGRGWVDFTRAIHAVTLFGSGFGELIQPRESMVPGHHSCNSCSEVPKGQDYLAVSVPNIWDILEKRGSTRTTPWRLVDSIYWHSPDKSFEPCDAVGKLGTKHDRVQVLLPDTFLKLWGRNLKSPPLLWLAPMGAVIFGHSTRFPLRWGDRGDPDEGQPDEEMDEIESSFHDTGMGTSSASPGPGVSDGSSSQSFMSPFQSTITPVEGPVSEEEQSVKKRRLGKELFGVGSSSGLFSTQQETPPPSQASGRPTHTFINLTPSWKKRKSS
ncbi:hypothetical protein F4803DRAFT_66907 [Xylaria telfairii]|nr:hypothetical protein F4803DRAFT_66907 [Xylaria telfairii]